MLKFMCTWPSLPNVSLHKSTNAKIYPVTESDKDLLKKIREDMFSEPFIAFTRKALKDEIIIRIRDSRNCCKAIVGNDTSRFLLILCVKRGLPYSRENAI